MRRTLSLDLETYSDVDLVKCGVYAYVNSPNFEILLMAYCFDNEKVKIIDLALREIIPKEVKEAILSDEVMKTAFNANFERTCLSKYLGINLKADTWCCSAVQASMLALPPSLEGVGEVLGLNNKKMKEGKELIKYFCCPCKPTKINGNRTRNLPVHDLEKWKIFKSYCIRDVEVESEIRNKLKNHQITEKEMELYRLDQSINDRGILVDMNLVKNAIACDKQFIVTATERAYELTGLENPNSVVQLKGWLKDRGITIESLSKKDVSNLVAECDGEIEEALKLRLLMSKTSVKKYEAIERSVCSDGRVHGLFQFYGANRTGRWAGRLVQVQNLPQNHIKDLELARNIVKNGKLEELEMFYESTPKVLSELVRTAFIPKSGCRFIVADFSAIEARVLAYLAGEKWRLDVFKTHGKIYEASASAMFHVQIDQIKKGSELRQKGKIAELALGYGGSTGALISMGALEMGLKEEELKPLVMAWRNTNPNITKFWWDVDKAAITSVKEKSITKVGRIEFKYCGGILFIKLPSGRKLSYIKPRLQINKFEREGLSYEGITESKKWGRIETYGPKLVENIVQAVARDLLAEAMLRLDKVGYEIVMHVHDEVIIEAPINKGSLNEVYEIMSVSPKWADGLCLRADGYECNYYKKD
ncbi:MAG: DNA polymerase [Clostridium neonatale]